MLSVRVRIVSRWGTPRFTLSTRTLPVSRSGGGSVVRGGRGCTGWACGIPNVSRGCEGRGMGTAPGTTRPPIGFGGMLLMFVSRT
jgi:hypothetical protein